LNTKEHILKNVKGSHWLFFFYLCYYGSKWVPNVWLPAFFTQECSTKHKILCESNKT